MSERDIFRPRYDPARAIYDAFQREAAKRDGREPPEWQVAETQAVLEEATAWARRLGRATVTWEQIVTAEASARGHIDYGAKWAYAVQGLLETQPT